MGSIQNSLIYATTAMIICVILGLCIAYLTVRGKVRGGCLVAWHDEVHIQIVLQALQRFRLGGLSITANALTKSTARRTVRSWRFCRMLMLNLGASRLPCCSARMCERCLPCR